LHPKISNNEVSNTGDEKFKIFRICVTELKIGGYHAEAITEAEAYSNILN